LRLLRQMNSNMRLQSTAPFDPGLETDFESFPSVPAVFALFPQNRPEARPDITPYLSSTRDLRRRLRRLLEIPSAHTRRLNLRAVTRRIEYQPVGSSFEAQWHLFELSRFYDPERFRRRLRLKPPALVKIKLRNRFPRCYPAERLLADGSLYFGPFPSRAAAERFTGEFLDLFKLRRCVPNLDPDPSHPGCIYSQMKMCLAPCFKGCTDEKYAEETRRVIAFLDSGGATLDRELAAQRDAASTSLEFEQAARAHHKLEKIKEVARLRPPLVKAISSLHAVMLLRGAGEKVVVFFRIVAGEVHGPASLSLAENVSSPVPLDQQIQDLLASLGRSETVGLQPEGEGTPARLPLPPWEHLSLLARWYYSSFRTGEIIMLPESQQIPHSRLIKLFRKVVEGEP
ncbi:MAG: hypothetical protein ACRD1I_07865, partial [Terriglobia bacterium]